jgi:hypothetical protein
MRVPHPCCHSERSAAESKACPPWREPASCRSGEGWVAASLNRPAPLHQLSVNGRQQPNSPNEPARRLERPACDGRTCRQRPSNPRKTPAQRPAPPITSCARRETPSKIGPLCLFLRPFVQMADPQVVQNTNLADPQVGQIQESTNRSFPEQHKSRIRLGRTRQIRGKFRPPAPKTDN